MTFSHMALPADIACLLDVGRRAEAAAQLADALDVLPSTAAAIIAGNLASREDRFPELALAPVQSFQVATKV